MGVLCGVANVRSLYCSTTISSSQAQVQAKQLTLKQEEQPL
jgi:hypothetical protein